MYLAELRECMWRMILVGRSKYDGIDTATTKKTDLKHNLTDENHS